MKVIQCDFERQDGEKTVKQTAWVDQSRRLKIGTRLNFKNDPLVWTVTRVGMNTVDIADINDTWEVGGIEESTARKVK